jgi:hypothetical protein
MGYELPLYGLRENPFEQRVLNPLRTHRDAQLLIMDIQGFRTFQRLDGLLADRAIPGRPVFFLVVGDSGTGRTSAANYLIYRWAKHKQFESDGLLVFPGKAGMDEADNVLYKLVMYMRNEIQARFLQLSDATDIRLTRIEDAPPGNLIPTLQRIVHMIYRDLREVEHLAFATVIEQLKAFDLVTNVLQVFRLAETIVVLTADRTEAMERDVLGQFDSDMNREIEVVRLSPLYGADVGTLVEERWRRCSKDPSPFDRIDVANAFSDARTIKRVLQIISAMLKLKQAEFGNSGLDPWPASKAELSFDEAEIRSKLSIIEDLGH